MDPNSLDFEVQGRAEGTSVKARGLLGLWTGRGREKQLALEEGPIAWEQT